jgi:hypothetical protein
MGSICNPHAQRMPVYQYRLTGEDYIAAQQSPLITLPLHKKFLMKRYLSVLTMIAVGEFMKNTLGYGA